MQDDDGDYEDHEGENMFVEAEDPFITDKEYKCEKCGKKKVEKQNTLFAPFHCDRSMKLIAKLEHKFDFETLTKRSIEKESQLFPNKNKPKATTAKTKKTTKTSSKASKPKAAKKTKTVKQKQTKPKQAKKARAKGKKKRK